MDASYIHSGVKEKTTTTGVDALVLTGADDGCLPFSSFLAIDVARDVFYRLEWGTGAFEIGLGSVYYDGSQTTLIRQNVIATNQDLSGGLVSLPAGEKTCSVVATAHNLVAVKPPATAYGQNLAAAEAQAPWLPPSATGERTLAAGMDASAFGDNSTALGFGASADFAGAVALGANAWATQDHCEVFYRNESTTDMYSIRHLTALSVYQGQTEDMAGILIGSGEAFVGEIDLVVRKLKTALIYHAIVKVSATSSGVTYSVDVIANTLPVAPGVALSIGTTQGVREGAYPILLSVTNNCSYSVRCAMHSRGLLTY